MIEIQLKIETKEVGYSLFLGELLFSQVAHFIMAQDYSKVVVITDENIAPSWLNPLIEACSFGLESIVIPAGEKNKKIETVQDIWSQFYRMDLDRSSLVINLGGGVVCDLGGFAASSFMRGIDFIQIPTTLLAQVDASIGGKVGVNFEETKNLIGAFVQPKAVFIDIATLKTLPKREFLSGFAEIIKHGLIWDKNYYKDLQKQDPMRLKGDKLLNIIARSCHIKATIVERDEREKGMRQILNFGHTIGHAIEAISQTSKPLLHGEAIALGMMIEADISKELGYLQESDLETLQTTLLNYQLPIRLEQSIAKDELKNKMLSDKKKRAGILRWTLLKGIGDVVFGELVSEKILDIVLKRFLSK